MALCSLSLAGCLASKPAAPLNDPELPFAASGASEGSPTSQKAWAADIEALPSPAPVASTEQISVEEYFARRNRLRGDAYALDTRRRHLKGDQELPCNEDELIKYDGAELPLLPVEVHPAFSERLRRFEVVAIEVAIEVYGRAPVRLRHIGAYVCRKSRFRDRRISEHALGNAIDVIGFDFGAARSSESASHLPPSLRWPFQVRVERHWRTRGGKIFELHHRFLHRLTERVVSEAIFRVALGPSHRGHENHFHFDMSPWSYSDL